MNQSNKLQLSELAYMVEQSLKKALPTDYWIIAEISECSINSKGHCYLEFIEKPEDSDTIVAKMRATIWSYNFRLIDAYFKSTTGIEIQAGIKVLVKVSVEYHALYGISLNVSDIDPIYTIGEDEKHRRDIIARIQSEGIIDMNKNLELTLVPQRIAIISSENAAGYQDFMQQLIHNQYNISFRTQLFACAMQGVEVENTIIQALDAIYENEHDFDAVVIIRGGGAKTDLRWFDNYSIAANVAQFPLPIISGIGHDKDESIVDIVAHTALKTPTAVAEFLIQRAAIVLQKLQAFSQSIERASQSIILQNKQNLLQLTQQIQFAYNTRVMHEKSLLQQSSQEIMHASTSHITLQKSRVNQLQVDVFKVAKALLINQKQKISLQETKIELHNPITILNKGYSYTVNSKGLLLKTVQSVNKGDIITTYLQDGSIASKVE